MSTFSDAERASIAAFYEHRKLVLERIKAALEHDKKRKAR